MVILANILNKLSISKQSKGLRKLKLWDELYSSWPTEYECARVCWFYTKVSSLIFHFAFCMRFRPYLWFWFLTDQTLSASLWGEDLPNVLRANVSSKSLASYFLHFSCSELKVFFQSFNPLEMCLVGHSYKYLVPSIVYWILVLSISFFWEMTFSWPQSPNGRTSKLKI